MMIFIGVVLTNQNDAIFLLNEQVGRPSVFEQQWLLD
jgi:hypothetical protein